MKTVGIIAEYNPFHNGHSYHIAEAKRLTGAERAVVVMSGSFVQRGEPACADKFTRAEWALRGGADMVVELPDALALSCAERFALGGVGILAGTGLVEAIAFGSESGDTETVLGASEASADPALLSKLLGEGLPYPAALSAALGIKLGPNDILGVEYARAARTICPGMELRAVRRSGSGHSDSELGGEFSSAGAIRGALAQCAGQTRMTPAVFDGLVRALPRFVLDGVAGMMRKGVFPATLAGLSDAALYRVRAMTDEELRALPEISEGLENLFREGALVSSDADELLAHVKSKRYTMARLKRSLMCALLGIDERIQSEAVKKEALYIRVLGVSSRALLSELRGKASLPVIVRSSDRDTLPAAAAESERVSALAHRIRALGQPYDRSCTEDISHRLIVRE